MPTDQLSTTFAALADPTRRAILARLVSGECSVTELAEPFDMSMPAVSKHLRVLERAGLIARGREAQWRPCRLEAGPLKAGGRLGRALSPHLGSAPRPPRCLSAGTESEGEETWPSAASQIATRSRSTTPSDREIVLTRLFDAPRRLVFEAMTKPEHVRRWWGILDERHSVAVCEIDLRPGGALALRRSRPTRATSRSTASTARSPHPNALVFTEIYEPFPDVESVVTSVFTEEDGKTRLTVTCLYPSLDVRDMVLKTGMTKGAAISYDRLEDVVRELQGA